MKAGDDTGENFHLSVLSAVYTFLLHYPHSSHGLLTRRILSLNAWGLHMLTTWVFPHQNDVIGTFPLSWRWRRYWCRLPCFDITPKSPSLREIMSKLMQNYRNSRNFHFVRSDKCFTQKCSEYKLYYYGACKIIIWCMLEVDEILLHENF